MTRTVFKYMKERHNGAIVSISSGSGNHPTPMLAVYSATKAFITQFSRSMHVECWGTGVDFLVVTPYYVVSNLYKRKTGTLIAPMPIELVKGTFADLGKQYIWQGHGYWFHGFLGNLAEIYPGTTSRYRKMMKDNRKRYDDKVAAAKESGDNSYANKKRTN
jgi:17beta-estradiol 17-dehydrogenase / very-long-chain 3-oxoacyl-CoA reductase